MKYSFKKHNYSANFDFSKWLKNNKDITSTMTYTGFIKKDHLANLKTIMDAIYCLEIQTNNKTNRKNLIIIPYES